MVGRFVIEFSSFEEAHELEQQFQKWHFEKYPQTVRVCGAGKCGEANLYYRK